MQFYSTKDHNNIVDLRQAVLHSLPKDRGLYMPTEIPVMRSGFWDSVVDMRLPEIAFELASPYLAGDFSQHEIQEIIEQAVNFDAPVVKIHDDIHSLELWHGPSLAFKDFGARFMAAVMSRLVKDESGKLTILVATSGDTGGAVAAGFLGVENVEVIILYPSGKVSPIQEKQLTTLGQNIRAIEVDGTFDDCQAMVKQAFLDDDLQKKYMLSSANSINISRLIPQSFYYAGAYAQLGAPKDIAFSVPSGNFGNMTAGLLAKRMGMPMQQFIAATNSNDIVPQYLRSGIYEPRPSRATISNAMDVGAPSNFQRIEALYEGKVENMRKDITGYAYNDEETRDCVAQVKDRHGYLLDPHGAVGYLALEAYQKEHRCMGVLLETAHPAKFLPVMNPIVGEVDVPAALSALLDSEKVAVQMDVRFASFKGWLMEQ